MEILTTVAGDGTSLVMVVRGDASYPDADQLPGRLERALAVMPDLSAVQVDVADVGFIDSYGLRGLIGMRRLADSHGCDYSIQQPSRAVLRLLELTNLADYLGAT
ncbi:MAG: STAS domain-containing protein [Acidimicrobiia bacterium]|nr:STAS domain-containing protein [Acidimicrobiia bacterium]